MEPPKDFTVKQIAAWLNALKKTPDDKAVHLLIKRIDIEEKTAVSVTDTLKTVLGKLGCGGAQPLVCTTFTFHTAA